MDSNYDLVLANGRVFDGHGNPSALRHVGIRDGIVCAVSEDPLPTGRAQVIDAAGAWVMPGFIDTHTHYDAEVLAAPALGESVRHGVTTVFTGSCSLSMIYVDPIDAADLYARVEALPYEPVLRVLQREMSWSTPEGWIRALESRALGPNVASMVGHSDLRASVMGLGRSTGGEAPSAAEQRLQEARLEEALSAGFVGLSTMTNPWDKLAGDRYRSRALPSTYASWREYGRLHRILRREGRILQSAPNLNTKVNMVGFFAASSGLPWRKPLKTTLISAADAKASPWLPALFGPVTRCINYLLRAELRWQAIPCPFEIYADGIDLVVFEEFGAGAAALHIAEEVERNELMTSESYRRRFRRDFEKRFAPRVWHRDFYDAHILACPDESLVGKSVGQVADARQIHPVDAFLDLVVAYGKRFRWKTLIANHRPAVLRRMLCQPSVHVGFADSGAHLRNMGFYNFPLHLLRMARDAEREGLPFLSIEEAVHRLTGELADWFGLDTGHLQVGSVADIAVIDPEGLDAALDEVHEADLPAFELRRMVRRNDAAVRATIVGGRVAFAEGAYAGDLGETRYGRFLRADAERVRQEPAPALARTA